MLYKINFLGTGNAIPSKHRNHSGIYINSGGKNLLLDCGENTQKKILEENLTFFVDAIFISHHHHDHIGGLKGYLKSMDLLKRDKKNICTIFCGNKAKLLQELNVTLPSWVNIVEVIVGVEYFLEEVVLIM